jgi:hypothetical protein
VIKLQQSAQGEFERSSQTRDCKNKESFREGTVSRSCTPPTASEGKSPRLEKQLLKGRVGSQPTTRPIDNWTAKTADDQPLQEKRGPKSATSAHVQTATHQGTSCKGPVRRSQTPPTASEGKSPRINRNNPLKDDDSHPSLHPIDNWIATRVASQDIPPANPKMKATGPKARKASGRSPAATTPAPRSPNEARQTQVQAACRPHDTGSSSRPPYHDKSGQNHNHQLPIPPELLLCRNTVATTVPSIRPGIQKHQNRSAAKPTQEKRIKQKLPPSAQEPTACAPPDNGRSRTL